MKVLSTIQNGQREPILPFAVQPKLDPISGLQITSAGISVITWMDAPVTGYDTQNFRFTGSGGFYISRYGRLIILNIEGLIPLVAGRNALCALDATNLPVQRSRCITELSSDFDQDEARVVIYGGIGSNALTVGCTDAAINKRFYGQITYITD